MSAFFDPFLKKPRVRYYLAVTILWWLYQKVYAVIASVKTNDALEPLNDGPAFAVTSSTVTSWTMAYSLLSALWAPIS